MELLAHPCGGQKLGIAFNPPAPGEAPGGFIVDLSYREGNRLRLFGRRCLRLRSRLGGWPPFTPRLSPGALAARLAYYSVPFVLLGIMAGSLPLSKLSRSLTARLSPPIPIRTPGVTAGMADSPAELGELFKGLRHDGTGANDNYQSWLLTRAQNSRGLDFRAIEPGALNVPGRLLDAVMALTYTRREEFAGVDERAALMLSNYLRSGPGLERRRLFGAVGGFYIGGGYKPWQLPAAGNLTRWPYSQPAPSLTVMGGPQTRADAVGDSPVVYPVLPFALVFNTEPEDIAPPAPRLGMAYEVGQRRVLRGGYGIAGLVEPYYLTDSHMSDDTTRLSSFTCGRAEPPGGVLLHVAGHFAPEGLNNQSAEHIASNLLSFNFGSPGGDLLPEQVQPQESVRSLWDVGLNYHPDDPLSARGEKVGLVVAGRGGLVEGSADIGLNQRHEPTLPGEFSWYAVSRLTESPAATNTLGSTPAHNADRRVTDGPAAPAAARVVQFHFVSEGRFNGGASDWVSINTTNHKAVVRLEANPAIVRIAKACSSVVEPEEGCALTPTSVQLSATAADSAGHSLRPQWATTGGRIKGEGMNVMWDLSGVATGTYSTSVTVDDGRGASACTTVRVTVVQCACAAGPLRAPAQVDEGPSLTPRSHSLEETWAEMQKQLS